jgi:hypothetical protein
MADQDRTFSTSTVEANRAAQQGLGVGQRELDAERDPGEDLSAATDPERTEAFDAGSATPPAAAEAADDGWSETEAEEDEELADEDRRTLKAEAERGQGAKTRQHQKDAISRRV